MPGVRDAPPANAGAAVDRACRWILDLQGVSGGWNLHPGGPSDTRVSVQPYCGLMMSGMAGCDGRMELASARTRDLLDRRTLDSTRRGGARTGTGFRGVLRLRYHMDLQYFPAVAPDECVRGKRWVHR